MPIFDTGIGELQLVDLKTLIGLTDDQIRERFKEDYKEYNGSYIYFICTNCGNCKGSPRSRTEDARIAVVCSRCE